MHTNVFPDNFRLLSTIYSIFLVKREKKGRAYAYAMYYMYFEYIDGRTTIHCQIG